MRRFRKLFVVLLVALCVVVTPLRYGMAVTSIPYNTVVYGPLDIGGIFGLPVVEGVGVCAHDKYAAAMTALGYGGDVVTGLDSDKRALLSNQSTGGAFWTFAQHFVNPSSNGNLTERMVYRYAELYGSGVVWSAEYQASEKTSAADALKTILDGGSLGGGGSGGATGDYYNFDVYVPYATKGEYARAPRLVGDDGKVYSGFVNGDGTPATDALLPNHILVKVPSTQVDALVSHAGGAVSNDGLCFRIAAYTFSDKVTQFEIYYNKTGLRDKFKVRSSTLSASGVSYEYYTRVDTSSWPSGYYQRCSDPLNSVQSPTTKRGYTFDGSTLVINDALTWQYVGSSSSMDTYAAYNQMGTGFVAIAGPTIPPSNWPDAPDVPAPTAPEVPSPTEPDLPTQPSTPTAPSLPDFPSYVIAPGTTYETFDIQAILDAMDEHCRHIQSAVYQGFSDYFDTFTPWLRDEFSTLRTFLREEDDWIVESISDEFMELRCYLKELAEWLADQMDFTITGGDYDDSTVVSWLKKIYFKLGGASVNTKPVDPVGDPDGSWDWLNQLIEGILSALAGGAANLAGSLGDLFQGIKDKFPFSIPWDIVAIVALLDAPPVTPAAVIEYDVFGAHVRYDIDLHFFDEQAAVIRAMENVLFCAFLLFKTNWLNGIFDGIGDFLGGKLKSTVKSP